VALKEFREVMVPKELSVFKALSAIRA